MCRRTALAVVALGLLAACSSDGDGAGTTEAPPTVTVEAPTAASTTPPDTAAEPTAPPDSSAPEPPDVEFSVWPVLAADVDEEGCDAEFVDGYCRAVDAPLIGAEAVESAVASFQDPGGWVVNLVFTADGIDAFNMLAQACFELADECPTARLAIELDGRVVSAPQVQAPSFERDAIVISGVLDQTEAEEIAAALDGP